MHKSKIVKLDTLLQDNDNARIHNRKNIDVIKSSIKEFGQYRPFVVDKNTNKVAVGNGMLIAMRELGFDEGEAVFIELNDKDFRLLSIADNRSCDMSKEDPALLLIRLKSIPDELRDLTGYTALDMAIIDYDTVPQKVSKENYDIKQKNKIVDEQPFCFSSLHFNVALHDYDKWVNFHRFNEIDDEDKLFKQLENFDNKIKDLLEFEYLRPNDNDKELVFREPNKFDRQGEVGTYIVCGEYKFYISKSQYLKWKENMQLSAGFNATEQINEIKRMLKLNENAN